MRLRAGARAPPARFWESREVQKRRWINGGEGSIVLDTLHSRNVSSHCQRWLRGSSTAGEDTWRLPTNHWLAEVVRARAVQCWRWAQQRHTRFKMFRWEDQLCRWHSEGCTKNPWENTGGGKTPKTVCLDGVQNSRFLCKLGYLVDLVSGELARKRERGVGSRSAAQSTEVTLRLYCRCLTPGLISSVPF